MFGPDAVWNRTLRSTRQSKMAAPDVVSARFKKWFFVVVVVAVVLGRSALCINDHRTQNQSLKQAPLAQVLREIRVWKSCHFGRHFKKRSRQTDRCIARTNRYRALPESAFLMQLYHDHSLRCSHDGILQPSLSKMRSVKILIRQRECICWFESSLGARVRRYAFWRYGSCI